ICSDDAHSRIIHRSRTATVYFIFIRTWWGFGRSEQRRRISTRGTTKARVLPEPVAASTTTSLKRHSKGITWAWTGVQKWKPPCSRTWRTGSERCGSSSEKRVVVRALLEGASAAIANSARLFFHLTFLRKLQIQVLPRPISTSTENGGVIWRRCVPKLPPTATEQFISLRGGAEPSRCRGALGGRQMQASGSSAPRPEAILEWLQKEMGYPAPLPSPELIRKVCRGNMVAVWNFLLQRVRSERTVGTARRNILVHGVAAPAAEVAGVGRRRERERGNSGLEERETALRERDAAEEEAARLRNVVRRQRKELRARMAEVAREESERKRMLDGRANVRHKQVMMEAYNQQCDEASKIFAEYQKRLQYYVDQARDVLRFSGTGENVGDFGVQTENEAFYSTVKGNKTSEDVILIETTRERNIRKACEIIAAQVAEKICKTFPAYEGSGIHLNAQVDGFKLGIDLDEEIPDDVKAIAVDALRNPPMLLRAVTSYTSRVKSLIHRETEKIDIKADAELLRIVDATSPDASSHLQYQVYGNGKAGTDFSTKGMWNQLLERQKAHVQQFMATEDALNKAAEAKALSQKLIKRLHGNNDMAVPQPIPAGAISQSIGNIRHFELDVWAKEREVAGLRASFGTLTSEVQRLNKLCEECREAEDALRKKWKKIEEFDARRSELEIIHTALQQANMEYFPSLVALTVVPHPMVEHMFDSQLSGGTWAPTCRRNLTSDEMDHLEQLLSLIHNHMLLEDRKDAWFCRWEMNGCFSVKNALAFWEQQPLAAQEYALKTIIPACDTVEAISNTARDLTEKEVSAFYGSLDNSVYLLPSSPQALMESLGTKGSAGPEAVSAAEKTAALLTSRAGAGDPSAVPSICRISAALQSHSGFESSDAALVSVLEALQFCLKPRGSEASILEELSKSINLVHTRRELVENDRVLLNHAYRVQQEYERTTNYCLKLAAEQDNIITEIWLPELTDAVLNAQSSLDDCQRIRGLVDEWWEQPAATVVDWVLVDGQNVATWLNHVKQLQTAFYDQELLLSLYWTTSSLSRAPVGSPSPVGWKSLEVVDLNSNDLAGELNGAISRCRHQPLLHHGLQLDPPPRRVGSHWRSLTLVPMSLTVPSLGSFSFPGLIPTRDFNVNVEFNRCRHQPLLRHGL
ncbi:hypothetical protein Taro_035449, partial [Colocasia esculenta]|nr:hypothetical protein [Colocasia esculenta]